MRKIIVGGIAVAAGAALAMAPWAAAGGNGAERSGLSPTAGSLTSQCNAGDGSGPNGFVMLNAPGPPGDANKLLGEVSLKNATPDTTYTVNVSVGNQNCRRNAT